MHGALPWVVLLNGVSCAGKTVLAREIVQRCVTPVIHLSLDHHHRALAARYATDRWPLYRQLVAGLARSAEGWWRQGFNVVIDMVLEKPRLRRDALALLPKDRTFIVGLRAPLGVLLARSSARREPEHERKRIRRQFPLIERQAHELVLSTDHETPAALAEHVLAHVGSAARSEPSGSALGRLRRIEADDAGTFIRAAESGGCRTWFHYFPFLHAIARTVRRELLWEEFEGSVLVYHRIDLDRGPRLSLFLPPFPFHARALAKARRRCRRFDAATPMRIQWVEPAALPALAGIVASKRAVDTEYVYDRARVAGLAGEGFATLRARLDRLGRVPGLMVRPYVEGDRAACEALIEAWRRRPKAERSDRDVYRLASLCVVDYGAFAPGLLRGEVVTQDGEVRGVAFGGPIGDGWGSLLVVIDDRRVPGLGDLQRYSFLRNNRDLQHVREPGDLLGPDADATAQAFQSVGRHRIWRVVLQPCER